jgi:stage II sporulation protein D
MFLTLLPLSSHLHAGFWDKITNPFKSNKQYVPSLRVLLIHDVEGAHLEIRGKYSLYDPRDGSYISSRFVGKSKYLETMHSGLKWGEAFPGLYQLKFRPDESSTIAIINGKYYVGSLYVYDIGGTISIVNEVPFEDFITSILSDQNLNGLHPEVKAALAIVARTNTYYQAYNPKTSFWAIDAQIAGYNGMPSSGQQFEEAQNATRLTRNMVMSHTGVYEGSATPFPAEFGMVKNVQAKGVVTAKISLEEANQMAKNGEHAAQILAKAFPGSTIMLVQ